MFILSRFFNRPPSGIWLAIFFWLDLLVTLFLVSTLCALMIVSMPAQASNLHGAELTRIARSTWGLTAPVPVFAAQIQQESGWNTQAKSPVGAIGMAQFMPATATWWCNLNRLSSTDCQPTNPQWAMRALVGYDKWLFERVWGISEYDRMHAALRAYNGGLGHWQREAQLAKNRKLATREQIDAMCGKAKRHISHCQENLGYPQRILVRLQPRFANWGRMLTPAGGAA